MAREKWGREKAIQGEREELFSALRTGAYVEKSERISGASSFKAPPSDSIHFLVCDRVAVRSNRSETGAAMPDFFISYTSPDRGWAEWIAYVLEEAGHSVIVQAWDFRPGSNFVLEMQRAAAAAPRTIMVVSPDYMISQFASPEWAAAFANDPQGIKRALVPIVVRSCEVNGLLRSLVQIDLVGTEEDKAREMLLDGVSMKRGKPDKRPSFPGSGMRPAKVFPGASEIKGAAVGMPYLPKMRRVATDVEKRRFLRQAFDTVKAYFQDALQELERHTSGMESDLQLVTAVEFTAEIFLHGKSVAACKVWQGGMLAENGISYAEGRQHFGNNSCNEILSLADDGGDLGLSSLMGIGCGRVPEHLNLKHLSPDQAAEYLWRRFVARLEI
jgi:hypothetical protein